MSLSFWLFPVVAGLIGYGTNLIAIAMILRPHEAKYVGKFRLPFTPGLVHRRKMQLAKVLAKTIQETLLTPTTLEKAIPKGQIQQSIKGWLDDKYKDLQGLQALQAQEGNLEAYLIMVLGEEMASTLLKSVESQDLVSTYAPPLIRQGQRLLEHPELNQRAKELVRSLIENSAGKMAAILFHHKVYEQMKEKIREYLADEALLIQHLTSWSEKGASPQAMEILKQGLLSQSPEKVEQFSHKIAQGMGDWLETMLVRALVSLNFQSGIESTIQGLSPKAIERIVMDVAKKELGYIAALGGILGFVIGLGIQLIGY